jgi:hypothetical protein
MTNLLFCAHIERKSLNNYQSKKQFSNKCCGETCNRQLHIVVQYIFKKFNFQTDSYNQLSMMHAITIINLWSNYCSTFCNHLRSWHQFCPLITSQQHRWSQYCRCSSLSSSALTWITNSLQRTEHWETHQHLLHPLMLLDHSTHCSFHRHVRRWTQSVSSRVVARTFQIFQENTRHAPMRFHQAVIPR